MPKVVVYLAQGYKGVLYRGPTSMGWVETDFTRPLANDRSGDDGGDSDTSQEPKKIALGKMPTSFGLVFVRVNGVVYQRDFHCHHRKFAIAIPGDLQKCDNRIKGLPKVRECDRCKRYTLYHFVICLHCHWNYYSNSFWLALVPIAPLVLSSGRYHHTSRGGKRVAADAVITAIDLGLTVFSFVKLGTALAKAVRASEPTMKVFFRSVLSMVAAEGDDVIAAITAAIGKGMAPIQLKCKIRDLLDKLDHQIAAERGHDEYEIMISSDAEKFGSLLDDDDLGDEGRELLVTLAKAGACARLKRSTEKEKKKVPRGKNQMTERTQLDET